VSLEGELASIAEARRALPPGARLRATRRAGERLGDRLREGAVARRVEVLAVDRVPCRVVDALDGGARTPRTWAWLERRALYLELTIDGTLQRVVVDPVARGSWRRTPWGAWFCEAHPRRAAALGEGRSLGDALASIGVDAATIDLAILTQLRGVDVAALVGTARGDGVAPAGAGALPRARWIVPAGAWSAALDLDEVETPTFVRDAMERVDDARVEQVGDRAIGTGAALIETPGWSAGSASLFVRSERGVIGWSSLGVALVAWSPYHARLPGLRERVRELDVESVPRGDAISRLDARLSMSLERAVVDRLADRPALHAMLPREQLVPHPLLRGHPE